MIRATDIRKTKYNAKKRNIEFTVSVEYLNELFNRQKEKCALSGLGLVFSNKASGIFETTASLDRINSNRGYVKGNVQWVHKHVNFMKHELEQKYFIKLCKMIVENNK